MKRGTEWLFVCLGTSFGLGRVPVAPGTAGALPGVALYWLIASQAPRGYQSLLIAVALVCVCVLTWALSPWAEAHWARKDPPAFVLDEVAGFLLTVLLFRVKSIAGTAIWVFCATRFFDIIKPPPARRLEALPKGWGILADDLCASLYAAAALRVTAIAFPALFGMSG